MKRALITGLMLALVIGGSAQAQAPTRLLLKTQTSDTDGNGKVTLGEIFSNADASSGVTIAETHGKTVVLDAARVQLLAQSLGLYWDNPNGLRRIIVTASTQAPAPAQAFVATPFTEHSAASQNATASISAPVMNAAAPIVIKRGDRVNVTWRSPSMTLLTTAIAMRDARLGEPADLQNAASKKPINGNPIATGVGMAEAGPLAQAPTQSATLAAR